MIHEFRDVVSVVTPLGTGRVLFVECQGEDNFYTVALDDTQALVTFAQNKLRICRSYTHERGISDDEMRGIIQR